MPVARRGPAATRCGPLRPLLSPRPMPRRAPLDGAAAAAAERGVVVLSSVAGAGREADGGSFSFFASVVGSAGAGAAATAAAALGPNERPKRPSRSVSSSSSEPSSSKERCLGAELGAASKLNWTRREAAAGPTRAALLLSDSGGLERLVLVGTAAAGAAAVAVGMRMEEAEARGEGVAAASLEVGSITVPRGASIVTSASINPSHECVVAAALAAALLATPLTDAGTQAAAAAATLPSTEAGCTPPTIVTGISASAPR